MHRLLIVDDDPALVRLLSILLQAEDFDVVSASSAEDGLALLTEQAPDLILLDLMMPVMDGREFYQKAREAGFTGPIVICSAYGAALAQRELGAQAAIDKPFEVDGLVDTVRSLLPRRAPTSRSSGCPCL